MIRSVIGNRLSLAALVAIAGTSTILAASDKPSPRLIPEPVSMATQEGSFSIGSSTRVVAGGKARGEAAKLIDLLEPAMGFRLKQVDPAGRRDADIGPSAITLSLDAARKRQLGPEGYSLEVTPERIDLCAAEPAGLFYGVQTLRQLLPPAVYGSKKVDGVGWDVRCVKITDYPRFGWRGLLIDPARHFIPVEDFKRFVDLMVLHKFNRLQVHLTDNEGWRIEIKKYPKLTEIGSKMDWSQRRGQGREQGGGPGRVGFYTQEDAGELVRYAADRHVTIVPEIEMPYHTGAAIVSYPAIGLSPEGFAELPAEGRWGKAGGLVAPRPETVAFMQDVLAEVIELFPSRFIHIGGDEANLRLWENDPEMQAQMKRLGCKDAHELHSWFIKQMDAFLTKHDRRLLGWDEILQGGLAPGATVMSWRGEGGGIAAAKAGHDVVMAPTSHTYFDYYQGPREDEPVAIGGHVPLEKVYQYEPIPSPLTAEQRRHVLGAQAQLWGEFIFSQKHREYMTYPRAAAFCEVVWSPKEQRDEKNFLDRLRQHLKRYDVLGVNYRPLD